MKTHASSNPLSSITATDLHMVARIEHHFLAIMIKEPHHPLAPVRRAFLSAILFGGLNDPSCWDGWLKTMLDACVVCSHKDIEFEVEIDKGEQKKRWYPDPITGLLLKQMSDQHRGLLVVEICSRNYLLEALAELQPAARKDPDFPSDSFPLNPERIANICAARLHMRIPGILADHASGRTKTHIAIKTPNAAGELNKLIQFLGSESNGNLKKSRQYLNNNYWGHLRDGFFPEDLTAYNDRRKSGKAQRAALDKQLEFWSKTDSQKDSLHYHILFWLRGRISYKKSPGQGSSSLQKQRKIGPSTARWYVIHLSRYDLGEIRQLSVYDRNCVSKAGKKVVEILRSAKDISRQSQITVRAIIRSLSEYLHSINPDFKLVGPAQLPKAYKPKAIVFDTKDFSRLREYLSQWGSEAPGQEQRSQACRLAAIIMFRTGLRGMEVANLALNDIVFEDKLAELVVRASAERSNKTRYSRRTLPLHILLAEGELAVLREWHAIRCDEEFRSAPRAKLFRSDPFGNIGVDQYLLEPIDAVIRQMTGESLSDKTRTKPGYWYALASPLRHSFANYLFATLLLPEKPLNRPLPPNLTPDLVSHERKQKLEGALLNSGQQGLSVMQAIRQIMGHASYERSVETYIHNIDWLLAAHLWRDAHQLPLTAEQLSKLFGNKKLSRAVVGDRQQRRDRAKMIASTQGALGKKIGLKRGRPHSSETKGGRRVAAERQLFCHHYLEDSAFGDVENPSEAAKAKDYIFPLPARNWRALHGFLKIYTGKVKIDTIATAQIMSLEDKQCKHWSERAQILASVKKMPGRGRDAALRKSRPRFPLLSHGWFDNPRDDRATLLDKLWNAPARRKLETPRHWKYLLRRLSRWQPDPPFVRSYKSIKRHADFLTWIGVPSEFLFIRSRGGEWQSYSPEAPCLPEGEEFQIMAAIEVDGKDPATMVHRSLHRTILQGLLMIAIDAQGDLFGLTEISTKPRKSGQQ